MRYKSNFNDADGYLSVVRNPNLSLKAKGIFVFIYQSENGCCDFDDIFKISKESFDSVNAGINELLKKKIISKVKVGDNTGVVYIIGDTYGNYKIGYAKSFYLRWKDYQTTFPYGPEIINLIKTNKTRELEKNYTINIKIKELEVNGLN